MAWATHKARDWLHCGSQIPSLPRGTREESRMVCQRLRRGQEITECNIVNWKIIAAPMDQIALILVPTFSIFGNTNAKEMCSSHPTVNDLLWHTVLFVSKGSERDYQLCVSSGKEKASRLLTGECQGKSKLGLIGFKMVTLQSQSNRVGFWA